MSKKPAEMAKIACRISQSLAQNFQIFFAQNSAAVTDVSSAFV